MLQTHHSIWGCRRLPCSSGGLCRRAVSSSLCANCARLEQTLSSNSWIRSPPTNTGMAPGAVLWCVCFVCCSCLSSERAGQSNERAHQNLDPGGPGGEGSELQHCHSMSLQRHHCQGESSQFPLNTPSLALQPEQSLLQGFTGCRTCQQSLHVRSVAGEAPRGALGVSALWCPLACGSVWAQLCLPTPPPGCASPGMQGETQLLASGSGRDHRSRSDSGSAFPSHGQSAAPHSGSTGSPLQSREATEVVFATSLLRRVQLPPSSSSLPEPCGVQVMAEQPWAAQVNRDPSAGEERPLIVGSGHRHQGEPAQMLPAPGTVN